MKILIYYTPAGFNGPAHEFTSVVSDMKDVNLEGGLEQDGIKAFAICVKEGAIKIYGEAIYRTQLNAITLTPTNGKNARDEFGGENYFSPVDWEASFGYEFEDRKPYQVVKSIYC